MVKGEPRGDPGPVDAVLPPTYHANVMRRPSQSGQVNITIALLLIALVVTGVWIWKRIPLDTKDYIVEQAIPVALVVLCGTLFCWAILRKYRRQKELRARRDRLIARFEVEPSEDKRLQLAFAIIEINDYKLEGLERVVQNMVMLFSTTLQTAVSDKQHRIRGMAASHLGVLRDKAVIPLLIKALEDDHAYVRGCAALGLGRMRATEAKDNLEQVMKDDWDQTVRSRAREAIERIK
jgi:hypothetical protein